MKYEEKLTHIDLFSGIGGFALAADKIFGNIEHVFCDNEPFAQEVLKKHWPESYIYSDIRTLTADTERERHLHGQPEKQSAKSELKAQRQSVADFHSPFLLTGGFPCQPFSQAGRRRGEKDDRFLWPEMLRVIREFSPLWVIAENVRGLLTQGGGVVFERVCTDLEASGYEVQPIIIPAVAIGAPHRRDRVWFVGHATSDGHKKRHTQAGGTFGESEQGRLRKSARADSTTPDTKDKRNEWSRYTRHGRAGFANETWRENWLEGATRLCRVDDGLPRRMDRNPRLKALGNAIVPQVAEEIMRAML